MPQELSSAAIAQLRENDRGDFTVPSAHLYPHQWAWDSGFAAIGWSHVDVERGLHEVERLFRGQWDDGRIPHIQFAPNVTDYFPGPEMWQSGTSSSITNPPVWTEALLALLKAGADRARIAALLPAVERSHAFFATARDPRGIGCVAVAHPWESGLDNSPAWDAAMATIDPALAPPFKRVDTKKVADPAMRPSDDHYKRYIVIVRGIHAAEFGLGPFAVYDPFMTSMVLRAEAALVELAHELGTTTDAGTTRTEARIARMQHGLVEHLWHEASGRYGFLDAHTGALHLPDVLPAYAPLFTAIVPDDHAARMLAHLEARYMATARPLPTTAPTDPAFDPRLYWRGPSWLSTNWLFAHRRELRDRLVETSLELVREHGFWEYFHPTTGDGLGADRFTWSAALALDFLARRGA